MCLTFLTTSTTPRETKQIKKSQKWDSHASNTWFFIFINNQPLSQGDTSNPNGNSGKNNYLSLVNLFDRLYPTWISFIQSYLSYIKSLMKKIVFRLIILIFVSLFHLFFSPHQLFRSQLPVLHVAIHVYSPGNSYAFKGLLF